MKKIPFAIIFFITSAQMMVMGFNKVIPRCCSGDYLIKSEFITSSSEIFDDTLVFTTPYDSCHQAIPICGDTNFVIYAPYTGINGTPPECCEGDIWPDCCRSFHCKGDTYITDVPRWFIIHIENQGDIMIEYSCLFTVGVISYVFHPQAFLYGPFDTPTGACLEGLVDSTVVDCCTHGAGPYTFIIPNALPGQFYLLNITAWQVNSNGAYYYLKLLHQGEPGYGSLDCNMMIYCTVLALTTQTSPCNPQTGTFTLSGEVYFVHPPQTGNLVVWDNNTGYATILPGPFVSPMSYSIPGLPCNNQMHTVTAMFWDSASCNLSVQYQAPVLCPDAVLSGGGGICEGSGGIVPLSVEINPNVQTPVTLRWNINGLPQETVTTNGPFPYIIQASQPGIYTLDTVYNQQCAGMVMGQATVEVWQPPNPNLGPDINLCEGREVLLDAGPGYQSYSWSTGDNTRYIWVNKSGEYSVTVFDNHNCQGSDTIIVNYAPIPTHKPIKHN
ncbi:MAG: hypothetical protein HPY80_09330 [Bacteroidales bacterium]|nr:hypothetical protein [Bacteroidales bacterium]